MDDLISRQAAIDTLKREKKILYSPAGAEYLIRAIENLPSAHPEIIKCKDCRWWEKYDDTFGYCHAAKHGHRSEHWDIRIWRVYRGDFYCADAELRLEEEGEDETN